MDANGTALKSGPMIRFSALWVEMLEDGYCAYADGGCHDVLRDCQIHSAAMGIIVAGDATAAFLNTKVNWRTSSSAEPQSVRKSVPPPLSSFSRTRWKNGTLKI